MKRLLFAASLTLAVSVSAAVAKPPTSGHVHQYDRAYHAVVAKFGRRAPGRNIARWGLPHRAATDADVVKSLGVLGRMLAPPPPPTPEPSSTTTTTTTVTSQPTTYAAPSSSLEACIIAHESGGNPQATNGQYAGIGQWSPSAWAQDGGTQYSSTPLGASYSQQAAVLASEGAAGMQQQQGQYDGC